MLVFSPSSLTSPSFSYPVRQCLACQKTRVQCPDHTQAGALPPSSVTRVSTTDLLDLADGFDNLHIHHFHHRHVSFNSLWRALINVWDRTRGSNWGLVAIQMFDISYLRLWLSDSEIVVPMKRGQGGFT